jgi:hypothetical protein
MKSFKQLKSALLRRIRYRIPFWIYFGMVSWRPRGPAPVYLAYYPDSMRRDSALPQLFNKWIKGNKVNNNGDAPRLVTLLLNARRIVANEIKGDFAELGVWKGNSAAVLASISRPDRRRLYLFDTFNGFDARDFVGSDAGQSVYFSDTSLQAVKQLIGEDDGTVYCAGYFPESLTAEARDSVFALAHIDCDLYEPMKAALEFFYPRLSPGGMIVMHDYSSGEWKGATRAIDEFLAQIQEQLVLVPDKSGTAIIAKSRLMAY